MIRDGEEICFAGRLRLVFLLGLPAVLAQISTIMMQYIDASMVGQYGANEAAAIGLVTTSIWLLWGISGAFTSGYTVQAAHRIGAKDFAGARQILREAMTVIFAVTTVLAVVALCIHRALPFWLGGSEEIAHEASAYFGIIAGTIPFAIMGWLAGGMLRASGDIKTPSLINVAMCGLDVLLNFFLIFPTKTYEVLGMSFTCPGADLGVAGAAWGTVLAEIAGALLMYRVLLVKSPILAIRNEKGSFFPRRATFRRAMHIGAPIGSCHILMTGAQLVTTLIVAPLGTVSLAAHSLSITAESLCYMPGFGLSEAATTLSGQTIGARRYALTRSFAYTCVVCGMLVMAAMGAVMYGCAPLMMQILSSSEAVRELGVRILRIEAFAEPLYAAAIVCNGVFVGAGDTFKPMLMNLFSVWFVRISTAVLLSQKMGLTGVWVAMCIELCIRGLLFLSRLHFGNWLKEPAA